MHDAAAMHERIAAHRSVLHHAKRAGVGRETPEMQQFVRSLFWMARNAGCYGLPEEAKQMFELAHNEALQPGWDYRLFGLAGAVLGWQRASRWADQLQRRFR
jgi:hypothetical protein